VASITEQPSPVGSHQFLDKVSLAYHQEVAVRLRATPDVIIARARGNLQRWLAAHEPGAAEARCLEEWQYLLETRSISELISILTEDSDEWQRLRQSTPFTGILSTRERRELVKRCEERTVA
jgi:frataxin-like iron-binding protein CyaY